MTDRLDSLLQEFENEYLGYGKDYDSVADKLSEKYSVTLRNTSESTDNNSDDKSITDEELVSKIESMIDVFNIESKRDVKNPISCYIIAKERVAEKLLKLFKTCRVMSNSSVITQTEQSINQEQLMSQIEDMTCDFADDIRNSRFPLLAKNTANFSNFKTRLKDCFTMHFNVDPKPSNDLVELSTIDEELVSKIEDMMKEGLVVNVNEQVCGIEDVACEIVNYFKETYLKQNFKPSKFSD